VTFIGLGIVLGLVATNGSARANFTVSGPGSYSLGPVGNLSSVSLSGPNGFSYSGQAGQFTWNNDPLLSPDNDIVLTGGKVTSFCIEIPEHVSSGSTYYFERHTSLTDLPDANGGGSKMNGTQATMIRQIWQSFHTDALTSGDKAAAFQVAIWTVLYGNGGLSHTTGSGSLTAGGWAVSGSSTILDQAKTYLTTFGSVQANLVGYKLRLDSSTGANAQDQLVEVTGPMPNNTPDAPNPLAAPAPPALILALCGIIPGIAVRRRLLAPRAA